MVKKKVWKAATHITKSPDLGLHHHARPLDSSTQEQVMQACGDEECSGLGPGLRVSAACEGLGAEWSRTGEKGLPETGIRETAEMTGHKQSILFFCEGVADGATSL